MNHGKNPHKVPVSASGGSLITADLFLTATFVVHARRDIGQMDTQKTPGYLLQMPWLFSCRITQPAMAAQAGTIRC